MFSTGEERMGFLHGIWLGEEGERDADVRCRTAHVRRPGQGAGAVRMRHDARARARSSGDAVHLVGKTSGEWSSTHSLFK